MSSRHKISAVLFVLLALPGLVAGTGYAACLHGDAAPESCCMTPTADIDEGSSCCATDEARPPARETTGDSCGCSHAPQAPADLAKVTAPAAPKTAVLGVLPVAMTAALLPTVRTPPASARSAPPGGAHAIFILDCAYLI
jgi:hypothetical protein